MCYATGIALGNGQPIVQFSREVYSISVNETSIDTPRPADEILTVECRNSIDNSTNHISYKNLSNDTYLAVNVSTGKVFVLSDLDYETNTFVSLEIECQSTLNESWTDRAVVNITVLPINEFRPEISTSTETVVITEGTPIGTVIISTLPGGRKSYSAFDRDNGPDGNIFYSIFSITNNVTFEFNSTIGAIYLAQNFDLDADRILLKEEVVQFTVCDSSPPTPDCLNIAVTIILAVGNDNTPVLTPSYINTTYPEDVNMTTIIAHFQCSDDDFIVGAFGGYEIVTVLPLQTPSGTFIVNSDGEICIREALDFEFTKYYEVKIRCFDVSSEQKDDFAALLINVTAVNEYAPEFFNYSHNISLSESISINSTIAQIQCVDDDIGQGELNNYELVMINPAETSIETFTVDHSGNVVNTLPLDFESIVYYELIIQCYDSGFPVMFDTTTVILNVEDANDNIPECLNVYDQKFSIGIHSHERMITINCTDRDSGINSNLRYTLDSVVPPLENGEFVLSSDAGKLNYHGLAPRNMNHTVTVIVSDNGTPSNSIMISLFVEVEGTTLLSPEITFPLWAIIVIIALGLLIGCVILICVLCLCYTCCRRRSKREFAMK